MARADTLSRLPVGAKLAAGFGFLALVLGAYYLVFYSDLADQAASAKQREQKLRTDLSEARKAEFAYQKDMAELTQRQQNERELNKVLPPTTEYPAFLSAVQNVANVSGVSLTGWSPNAEIQEQFYARVPMRVELVGRFHQVAKFFNGIGHLDRIINIENITLSDPKMVGEDVVLRVDGLATAFRALDKTQLQQADKRGAAKGAKP